MKMLNLRHKVKSALRGAAVALLAATGLTSCESLINDDAGDCSVHYRVHFRYIKNVLGADAFGPQVTDVSLYIFDKQGNPVMHRTAKRQTGVDNDFYMEIDLAPGTYDMLAWCEGTSLNPDAISFNINNADEPARMSDLSASLPLQGAANALYSNRDIHRFYHGMATSVVLPNTYGTVDLPPIMLTKDTNHLSVLLHNANGEPLDKSQFTFEIKAANSNLTWQNEVTGTPEFVYRPWVVNTTQERFDHNEPEQTATGRGDDRQSVGVLAELTTSRLMADREQELIVRNAETGEPVVKLPLIEYLLLVKGKYNGVGDSDQDYLDCYDDFTLMFFLGGSDGQTWLKARIFINGWRVVPPQLPEL